VDALGADKVWCVMLPSRYTSTESLVDATECAHMLGVRYDTVPIVPAVKAFDEMLGPVFTGRAPDLAEENIQSRIRGVTLMALSNKFGQMLLTTGNKSEMSVGYATIYGDMNGGYNPLKDAYKQTVFALSRWRNRNRPRIGLGPDGPVMPDNIISKPPAPNCAPTRRIPIRCPLRCAGPDPAGPCRAREIGGTTGERGLRPRGRQPDRAPAASGRIQAAAGASGREAGVAQLWARSALSHHAGVPHGLKGKMPPAGKGGTRLCNPVPVCVAGAAAANAATH
jgi:hypothetical protein